jgi:FKBP-type peptidyl-prolyl cis-trans isomerase 2
MEIVKKGDKVKVEYVGMLEDGTVFDSSQHHGGPLEFEAGSGQLIKGFDDGVLGMKPGEEKEIKIVPNDGYGNHDPQLVKEIPRNCFTENQEIEPGMMFMMTLQNGRQIPVKITNVSDTTVTIDANPPLAGKTLIFKIKIVDVAAKFILSHKIFFQLYYEGYLII